MPLVASPAWKRTKRRVPKGARCHFSRGWKHDALGDPVVIMCPNSASVVLVDKLRPMWFPAYACEECAVKVMGGPDADK